MRHEKRRLLNLLDSTNFTTHSCVKATCRTQLASPPSLLLCTLASALTLDNTHQGHVPLHRVGRACALDDATHAGNPPGVEPRQ